MNLLSILFNCAYRAAAGDPYAQRMLAAGAQGYNDQMAAINHTEPVQALWSRADGEPGAGDPRGGQGKQDERDEQARQHGGGTP